MDSVREEYAEDADEAMEDTNDETSIEVEVLGQ